MRRTALALLAALGLASLASAAAHDWTSVSEIDSNLGSIEDLDQDAFTVAVLFDDTLPNFEMSNTRPSQSGGILDRAQFSFSTWDDYGDLRWIARLETYIEPNTEGTEEVDYLTQAETYLLRTFTCFWGFVRVFNEIAIKCNFGYSNGKERWCPECLRNSIGKSPHR